MNKTLQEWLQYLEQLQPEKMELGLDRIKTVAKAMVLLQPSYKIITVAGTNGKGSTVAYCDAMLRHQGYSTGVYTSPHFIDFNERIVINDERVDDYSLCEAFEVVEKARGDVALTYFEYTTLAAVYCFQAARIDVAILEVGLGGRLDAVNAWDSEVACISSIGIDHTDWLGNDREVIGREKAGVARAGKALVCGDLNPPESIAITAGQLGAVLVQRERDFYVEKMSEGGWQYQDNLQQLVLPRPVIDGAWAYDNAAVAINAVSQFYQRPVAKESVVYALQSVMMTGRMQHLSIDGVSIILDVAHNRVAAEMLAVWLDDNRAKGRTYAVFGCMRDKDVSAIVEVLSPQIDRWCIAEIDYPRAMQAADIEREVLRHVQASNRESDISSAASADQADPQSTQIFASVIQAGKAAVAQSGAGDRIVVFGSFHVVGPALALFQASQ